MPTYPTLTGGTSRISVLNESIAQPVRVKRFTGGQEQRWRPAAASMSFDIQHTKLSWADLITLRNFWVSQQGVSGTWSLAINGSTFSNCVFIDKTFPAQEPKNRLVSITLKARQVLPEATISHPTIGGAAPSFPTGILQVPYTVTLRYNGVVVDRETGPRYLYLYDAAALISFDVTLGAITSAEMTTLQNFWNSVGGNWAPFSFTDPDTSTVYTNMRFDQAELLFALVSPNMYQTSFRLTEKR